ncbi:phosphotransferase [Actinomadura sp. NBRC 104412]|uniref:phosphotransferase n=1 Tax=Actinomadura sp. NBRC 104412 TaxID=3032203 RepID=UPI00249FE16F|nr:phosphotransferase [Actinomadura sp. NBRC 104412]GLZ06798.1 phosphotransferase [Actinomadura sp. NBRC 104412]
MTPQEWTAERLRRAGITITGPAEQAETRAWSCQFRVPTTAGTVYFKSSPPAFGHEAALTRALAEWSPGDVPEVLAADPDRNWMLTADFGTGRRYADPARFVHAYTEMIPAFVRIQANASRHVGELGCTGCPDHRLATLPERFDTLVREAAGGGPLAGPRGLAPDELSALRRLTGPFGETCRRLAAHGVPETVVHADIWRGNFLLTARGPVVFDWAESMIGHPFLSLEVMLADVRTLVPGDRDALDLVRDTYLEEWRRRGIPAGRAEAAVRLTAAPALVSRALMWRDAIAGLDDATRPRYEGAVAQHLRHLRRLLVPAG